MQASKNTFSYITLLAATSGTYSNLTSLFWSKNISVSMIYKIEISQFYPNNGIETKSDIFPWDIFKSGVISFFIKKTFKKINGFQNQNLSGLWLKWTQKMEIRHFQGTYSNLTSYFIGSKILKYFNGFCNWHLSISPQKRAQTSKAK